MAAELGWGRFYDDGIHHAAQFRNESSFTIFVMEPESTEYDRIGDIDESRDDVIRRACIMDKLMQCTHLCDVSSLSDAIARSDFSESIG